MTNRILRVAMITDLGKRSDRPNCPKQYGNWLESLAAPLQLPIVFCVYSDAFMGLQCTETQFFDLIIAEKNLRHLNGLEILGVLKAANASTPIILMVREGDASISASLAHELGYSALITDALHSTDLCMAISNALCAPIDYCSESTNPPTETIMDPLPLAKPRAQRILVSAPVPAPLAVSGPLSAAAGLISSSGGISKQPRLSSGDHSHSKTRAPRMNPPSAKNYFEAMFDSTGCLATVPVASRGQPLSPHECIVQPSISGGTGTFNSNPLGITQVAASNGNEPPTSVTKQHPLPPYTESITPITAFLANDGNFTVSTDSSIEGHSTLRGRVRIRERSTHNYEYCGIDRLYSLGSTTQQEDCDDLSNDEKCQQDIDGGRESTISQCMLNCPTPTEYFTHLGDEQHHARKLQKQGHMQEHEQEQEKGPEQNEKQNDLCA